MMNVPKILVDGIESISMADGIVRMTFFCYSHPSYSGKPGHENVCEIITSPAGVERLKQAIESISAQWPHPVAGAGNREDSPSHEQDNKNVWETR